MTDERAEEAPEEREFTLFRQQYYGLLASLLAREPREEILQVLREGILERTEPARMLHPLLGEGWDYIQEILPALTAESAEQEFLRLFIGPFQPEVTPYESWYVTGQLFGPPLVALRVFLGEVGLAKQEDRFSEPEDVLAFELEIMNWLISRQLHANSAHEVREWLHRQSAFLTKHLLIWAPRCAQDLGDAKSSSLYKGAALLLQGLIAIERQRLQGWGVTEIETLEQAKRRYGAPRAFRGPVFDPSAPPKVRGSPPSPDRKE